MAIADGNGLPIGIYVISDNHQEIKLVQPNFGIGASTAKTRQASLPVKGAGGR
jgi:hypothetical protein